MGCLTTGKTNYEPYYAQWGALRAENRVIVEIHSVPKRLGKTPLGRGRDPCPLATRCAPQAGGLDLQPPWRTGQGSVEEGKDLHAMLGMGGERAVT